MDWARMSLEPSQYLVLNRGKDFNISLWDKGCIQSAFAEFHEWLKSVDRAGKFNARIYQQAILRKILCHLLVFEGPVSTV